MDLPEEELMTSREVADLLRVRVGSVARWAQQGVIPAIRIGRGPRSHLRFRASDIRDLLDGGDQ